MRFINPIPFVSDIERSRDFYQNVIGVRIVEDFGNFILFETGFAIHHGPTLERTIWGREAGGDQNYGRQNLLLYFEHEDVDAAFARLAPHVELIHPVERQEWGQRVFRFYDPDRHAIEIGEPQTLGKANQPH